MPKKQVDLEADMQGLNPGDYGKDKNGVWWFRPPADPQDPDWPKGIPPARIGKHTVVEHPDGTITVSPSLVFRTGVGIAWHGWLRNGIYTKV